MAGGYDIKLVDDLPENFKCPHCSKLMKDPVQTMFGERACKSCYLSLLGNNSSSTSTSSSKSYFLDKHAIREIDQLPCRCYNEPNCQWIGIVKNYAAHEKICEYRREKCRFCSEKIVISELEQHQNELCAKRTVVCKFCGEELLLPQFKIHQLTCFKAAVQCPFNCGQSMHLVDVGDHMQSCRTLLVGEKCPYTIIGCTYKPNNASFEEMKVHLHENLMQHSLDSASEIFRLNQQIVQQVDDLKILTNKYEELDGLNQELQREKIILQKEIEKLKVNQTSLQKRLKGCNEGLIKIEETDLTILKQFKENDFEDKISRFEKELKEFREHFDPAFMEDLEIVKSAQDLLKKCENSIDKQEKDLALINVNLSDLTYKMQLLEQVVYDGRQVWKVDNITKRIHEARNGKLLAVHSPPAFTKRGGYKFCSRLYPNGDGTGKGSHMSLFFVLMKSEYDGLCSWPFSSRVTFRIINPKDDSLSHRETFIPDKRSSSFQRPTKDMNVAAGCPMFIRIDTVENRDFIIDDSLFLEIVVGPYQHVT